MLIYIAGPITEGHGFTVEENVAVAIETYLQLSREGVLCFCPHLTALVEGAFDVPYRHWMRVGLKLLESCDGILMLPRWEQSNGAKMEHERAVHLGMCVYRSVPEVLLEANKRDIALGIAVDLKLPPNYEVRFDRVDESKKEVDK